MLSAKKEERKASEKHKQKEKEAGKEEYNVMRWDRKTRMESKSWGRKKEMQIPKIKDKDFLTKYSCQIQKT